MKHCESLLMLVYITLLPAASEASSVTGHLGDDIVLPCGNDNPEISITQVQWDHMRPEGNHSHRILVFNPRFGVNISESPLRDRVAINEHSLMIKNLKLTDAGVYTCTAAAFPTGSFEITINLIVQDQSFLPLSAVTSATVAVMLLLGILAAIAYLAATRCGSSVRRHVDTNTSSAVTDASTHEDVVYTKVKLKTSRGSTASSSRADTKTTSDDVTYAEVVF